MEAEPIVVKREELDGKENFFTQTFDFRRDLEITLDTLISLIKRVTEHYCGFVKSFRIWEYEWWCLTKVI